MADLLSTGNKCIIFIIILGFINFTKEITFENENSLDLLTQDLKSQVFGNDGIYNTDLKDVERPLLRGKRQTVVAFPIPQPRLQNSTVVIDYYIIIPLLNMINTFNPIVYQLKFSHTIPNFTFPEAKSFHDRIDVYGLVESFFSHFGLHGRSCMLRAICERNEYHVIVDGIIGEAVNLILEFSTPSVDIDFDDYYEAKEHGRNIGDCSEKYRRCPISIFSWSRE